MLAFCNPQELKFLCSVLKFLFFFEAWMKICQDHHTVVCFLENVLLEMIPLIFHVKSKLKLDENRS